MKHVNIIVFVLVLFAANLFISVNDCPAACLEPPDGMVSWWPGDEHAIDIIGENNGTLKNGTTYRSGKVDQAFSFDGVDDIVHSPIGEIGDLQQITVDLWVKLNSLPSGEIQRFVSIGDVGPVLRYQDGGGSHQLHFYMHINDNIRHIFYENAFQIGVKLGVKSTFDFRYFSTRVKRRLDPQL